MTLNTYPTNRSKPHSNRATGQYIQMMGVWGWLAIIFFIGYLAVSCLASHMEQEINAGFAAGTNPLFNEPVEFGGKLTAPGEFILAHAETLAWSWLAIVMIAGICWVMRKYKL